MIRTWIADIRPLLEEECYRKYYALLPDFRKEKADKLKILSDRAQSVGAWTLLEKVREKYDISQEHVYNLSHAGDYVLCSVEMSGKQGVRLGCDLEPIRMEERDLRTAKRCFCESEYEWIMSQHTPKERAEAFCRMWVLKESFLKATRRGLALGLKTFEVSMPQDGEDMPPVLTRQPEGYEETYYYKEYKMTIPYRIAICTTETEIDTQLQMEWNIC